MGNDSIKVSASILSANFLFLSDEIKNITDAGVDSLHLDVMDNHMAPSLSFGPPIIKPIRGITPLTLDAHLMIDAPWLFFDSYIDCGVDELCIHVEAYDKSITNHEDIISKSRVAQSVDYSKLKKDLHYLKSQNISPGITINPNTSVDTIFPILDDVDSVLVMSVHPGFSGQSFIPDVVDKIKQLRTRFSGDIKVDGGVNDSNSKLITSAG
ncbi:MAG: ribulose-phosphate 3-epimerase, partial [Candidatus Margulisiibacteriota bacterium]